MALAVVFGLLAAFLFAASAALQQHAAQSSVRAPGARRPGTDERGRYEHRTDIFGALLRLIRRLIRHPLWLTGWLVNLLGFATQAVALYFGSVALVQPLLVTQLLFALPMAAATRHEWPIARDWAAAAAITAGLVVFLTVRGIAPMADDAHRGRLILAGVAAAGAVVLLVLVAAGLPRAVRATVFAIAAGLCFAYSAAMIKVTTDDLVHRGVAATARDWPGYALALSTLTGLIIEQGAFAAGTLPAAVAAMSITNPIASYLLGVFAFGAAPPGSIPALAGLAVAGALICVGALGLAASPLVRPPNGGHASPDRVKRRE